ncbi:MAG: hypothetical protein VKL39_18205 [Leptolyngbyaceae bacterium]|nr:hypothetical protein [Leptolyngbyaceae bacterium]
MILNPDFPHIIWSFTYRGWQLEVDQSEDNGQVMYAVWANHEKGCAVAVPFASTQADAIKKAKQYVDARINHPSIYRTW